MDRGEKMEEKSAAGDAYRIVRGGRSPTAASYAPGLRTFPLLSYLTTFFHPWLYAPGP
jgi:hypothetical protein